jgi:hypothetical protein
MKPMKNLLSVTLMSSVAMTTSSSWAQNTNYNRLILETLREMPEAGGYSVRSDAFEELRRRIVIVDAKLQVDHLSRGPSFCSGATYLVFLKVIEKLVTQGEINLSDAAVAKLLTTDTKGRALADGFGVWGRWNANGPGTAGLFADLDLGDNFSDDEFQYAEPGDFLKIFWKSGKGVGKNERGHSVVFTHVLPEGAKRSKIKQLCFWSSNTYKDDPKKNGFGEKCVDRKDIAEMIFSRLERPQNLQNVLAPTFSHENPYLSKLLEIESNIQEARQKTQTRVIQ